MLPWESVCSFAETLRLGGYRFDLSCTCFIVTRGNRFEIFGKQSKEMGERVVTSDKRRVRCGGYGKLILDFVKQGVRPALRSLCIQFRKRDPKLALVILFSSVLLSSLSSRQNTLHVGSN